MELRSQQKNPLKELVKDKLAQNNWNAAELSRRSNVPPSVISRLLNRGKNVSYKHIYSILITLDLIETGIQKPQSPPGWTFNEKARSEYHFLTNIVSEANEGSREGYSADTLCQSIIKDMEKQLLKLQNTLKKGRR